VAVNPPLDPNFPFVLSSFCFVLYSAFPYWCLLPARAPLLVDPHPTLRLSPMLSLYQSFRFFSWNEWVYCTLRAISLVYFCVETWGDSSL